MNFFQRQIWFVYNKSDFGLQSYYKFVFSYLLYKMNRIFVPIFFIYPILLSIEIQLIHSECYQNVFGLPQFFIRVPVRHTYGLHHISTSRIVYIMCSCDIRNAYLVSTCRPLPGTLRYKFLCAKTFSRYNNPNRGCRLRLYGYSR